MLFQPRNKQKSQQSESRIPQWLWAMNLAAAIVFTPGCGGGGATDSASVDASATDQGEVIVALTDAEGDFLSYTVDVQSITLEKANGAMVETVPINTRVDFAEYTDMTEFFTILTLPTGSYTKVNLHLDFSDSEIIVQDSEGDYQAASVVDTEGDTITNFTVQVNFSESDVLTIKKGVPAKLTIDFDLDSSNTILSYDPAVVEVEPIILADASLDLDRKHRGRGLLKTVDVNASTFDIDLKPFRHREGSFGAITLHASDETQYEVNGSPLSGSEGLAALDALAMDTPLIVYGQMTELANFEAVTVLAGSSVPWVGRDAARGIVIAREADVLTLRGSHVERSNGAVTFYDNITVNLGADTHVTREALSNEGLTKDDISIGQRVIVFGDMNGDMNSDMPGSLELNATEGHVRMLMNVVKGEVVSLSPLAMDLRWLNGRRIGLFDFDGTGVTEEQDADPDSYDVETGALSLENLALGSLIKVRGYPVAYGASPDDFNAQTVIDINTDQRAGVMNVRWHDGGSNTPFKSTESESLVLDVENALYQVTLAGVPLTGGALTGVALTGAPLEWMDGLQNGPVVAPLSLLGRGIYAVKVAGQPAIQVFKSFDNYVEALNTHLSAGESLRRMVALGRYDQTVDSMSSVVVTSRFTSAVSPIE